MPEIESIADGPTRRLAETTFDRNVVVVAGAGTGKTTLLVNRFVHTLMREPHPVPITQVVALTFTNKAATEMKIRLREQLTTLARTDQSLDKGRETGGVGFEELRQQYGLSTTQVAERANAALVDIEKSPIGTLHSFAAHLLRLYPIESRVDQNFQEDDGSQFENYFNQAWEYWLDAELGRQGSNHTRWNAILAKLRLVDIRQLAFAVCNEIVSLDELLDDAADNQLPRKVKQWFSAKRTRVANLLEQYDSARRRKIESGLAAAQKVFDGVLEEGMKESGSLVEKATGALNVHLGKPPKGWEEDDFHEARQLLSLAKAVLSVDQKMIRDLLLLLVPFVQRVRAGFLDEGLMTFDSLLARARALLRDHPLVRERLKQDYKAILVDEFQDTDPIQYEIILYLAERTGCGETEWKNVELAPGKLFIVGDPKQSIYAFRRADLEAFDQVVRKIKDSGGMTCELATNFRSHHRVLDVVNTIFGRVFQPKENVQPANVELRTRPNRTSEVTSPGVELHIIKLNDQDENVDSVAATRLEADHLARWIKEELLAHEVLTDASGGHTPLRPGHIGLLFRKLTQAQEYLDALRKYDIPFVTDGEKHFYRRQEVIDLVNVLRVIENPSDTIALVGVLRSPLGGLPDRDIYELQKQGTFDYRQSGCLKNWINPRAEEIRRLYEVLLELHLVALTYSFPALIDLFFSRLPVLELAAASLHGEQAVANLHKVREIAVEIAERPHLSLNGFVDLLIDRLAEQREEAERGLAEESLDAIRVLTIHKAKGLEFPVVILPGLHHGASSGNRDHLVSNDWASGVLGVSVGGRCTLGAVMTKEKYQVKEEAEQRRVFYVAMTRAKERLILSGGFPDRLAQGTFLHFLREVADTEVGLVDLHEVRVGTSSMRQLVVAQKDHPLPPNNPSPRKLKKAPHTDTWLRRWDAREKAWSLASSRSLFLTPTSLFDVENPKEFFPTTGNFSMERGKLIGVLAHRVLERWNYQNDFEALKGRIEDVCRYGVPPTSMEAQEILTELVRMFQVFYFSEPYRIIQGATILGREVPFAMPWDCSGYSNQAIKSPTGVMEGVIDLIYQVNGKVWVADYKTDDVDDDDITPRVSKYDTQTKVYRDAARQCLGLTQVGCQLLFLRHGASREL